MAQQGKAENRETEQQPPEKKFAAVFLVIGILLVGISQEKVDRERKNEADQQRSYKD